MKQNNLQKRNILILILPLLLCIFFFAGFAGLNPNAREFARDRNAVNNRNTLQKSPFNYLAFLTPEQFSKNIRDTVYTDRDLFLELRIDEQVLYVHYRDGRIKTYPISSGNKFISKGVESRPGLFAVFMKEELHLSTQFNDARMYNYMPYNMGIGFHSLGGTGYYGNLGIRPSSHGCIRMRAEDARTLFKECDIGTIVLSHRGKTVRVIAFAPEGFKNEREYTKDDYMKMLAYNLNSIYGGRYLIDPPKRFIIEPAVIPSIGFNVGSSDEIPETQQVPYLIRPDYGANKDKLNIDLKKAGEIKDSFDPEIAEVFQFSEQDIRLLPDYSDLNVGTELIDKYVYNRAGILPYFPPDR